MTVGQSTIHAHAILNVLRGTTYTGVTPFVQLHTADPGASGTTAASATTSRQAMSLGAPSAGSAASSPMSWANWVPSGETITHFSIWTAATGGSFLQSGALAASKKPDPGDTLNLTVTLSQGPLAA